ncbi:lysophospholipid acyltransferase family protein [Pelagicoccus sp. SDUM812003]|uniref:lysophospholipid acyltransferase family protein n=1 Tax=Pelagicoccus sp. SDUM812003 TaxID=3041267 RepID=UPI00280C42D7|nr:lysophospholipid acyltransferase family protein [Pelagicoccus sp. SDUM812003]MDQ8205165.1 lysophospholipid acyltransferase family protein [Pelagicoccus sp. SDUM812003]
MEFLNRHARLVLRLLWLAGIFVFAGIDHFLKGGKRWSSRQRSLWQQRWSGRLLRGLGFEVTVRGAVPERGFIAPNHLSYMDIVVLASVTPQVFLSKSEVGDWPVVGYFTRIAGTLFIDRARRADVANKEQSFARVIEADLCMTFFLEGTSTDGRTVLPFRSSLLDPVVRNRWPITPAYLKYECEGGDPANDVCWWGDMGFGEHLLRLCKVRRVKAEIVFGEKREPGDDRKQLALDLFADVQGLSERAMKREATEAPSVAQ